MCLFQVEPIVMDKCVEKLKHHWTLYGSNNQHTAISIKSFNCQIDHVEKDEQSLSKFSIKL